MPRVRLLFVPALGQALHATSPIDALPWNKYAPPEGPVTVTWGDVLYHSSVDHTYAFHTAHMQIETQRHFDNLGFSSGVAAPAWDTKLIPNFKHLNPLTSDRRSRPPDPAPQSTRSARHACQNHLPKRLLRNGS
jgi:hypothetical protein